MSPPHGICEYWCVSDPPQLMRSLKLLNTWNSQAITHLIKPLDIYREVDGW